MYVSGSTPNHPSQQMEVSAPIPYIKNVLWIFTEPDKHSATSEIVPANTQTHTPFEVSAHQTGRADPPSLKKVLLYLSSNSNISIKFQKEIRTKLHQLMCGQATVITGPHIH